VYAQQPHAVLNRGRLRDTVAMRGELIALVGTSSVGKTSVSEQLQPMLPAPHLVVGIDLFLSMFPHPFVRPTQRDRAARGPTNPRPARRQRPRPLPDRS
jgi:chloramphenicol 3-O-phosphotransferase